MAFLGGDNQVDILIKSSADNRGIDETNRSLSNLSDHSGTSGKSVAALGMVAKTAAIGIAAAGAAVGTAGVAAIKSAGSYEQSRIAFETMLGSADKARVLMQQIADFAKSTPFELPEVVQGTKQLLAFGFAQDQLLPTMRKLGDLASGLGVPVGQLTNVFGQVRVCCSSRTPAFR
jgi:phage tail tape-measure protein